MIEGGWPFVYAAYGVALPALGVLALIVFLRARHWANAARKLEQTQNSRSKATDSKI